MAETSDRLLETMMRRCFDLARQGQGYTSPNPMVGSVLAVKDQVLSEGFHPRYRQIHAEAMALNNARDVPHNILSQATLYVSLEPCFHYGFNPPCVDRILESPVQNVVISCMDPNPLVAGKSIARLKASGRSVTLGILAEEGEQLIRAFRTRMTKERPYVVLKWAESNDGYMGKPGQNVRISNDLSQVLTHRWRHELDAFLVGGKTVIVDNPQLNNRLYWGSSPHRIVYSTHASLPVDRAIWKADCPTILFSVCKLPDIPDQVQQFELPANRSEHLRFMLATLMHFPINSLLVEGGPHTLQSFIDQGVWDEVRIIRGRNQYLGSGLLAPTLRGRRTKRFDLGDDEVVTIFQDNDW
ncbi:MAG: bifunctional diaminohydroxyphosphoribosylaminopyrimidine deaminase/5-amino-6-(5-phosphoribosylamino)uracil reductase RibD [Saprospiraceae bacterium]|nr:bifunctional diaminohydroxyphosphoribosylaminopyrimidine deaminase/5-amino-6-(5-phosphoribosylamino)uracil reductase RibD [Saprospiraceae bacterium]